MNWKAMAAVFFLFGSALFGTTPQLIHKGFVLSRKGFEKEAQELFSQILLDKTFKERFLAEQFIEWSIKRPSAMKRHFNKAALHILSDDREAAKRALLVYFNENSDGLEDFVNSLWIGESV